MNREGHLTWTAETSGTEPAARRRRYDVAAGDVRCEMRPAEMFRPSAHRPRYLAGVAGCSSPSACNVHCNRPLTRRPALVVTV